MTQADLSDRTGLSAKTINLIINGKAPISNDTALILERVLGAPAHFWMTREQKYREYLARLDEEGRLAEHAEWLKMFPIPAMARLKWIQLRETTVQQIQELLNYFGIADPGRWSDIWGQPEVAYRKSKAFTSKPGAVSAWLRRGEIVAQQLPCEEYDAGSFKRALGELRALTRFSAGEYCNQIISRCASAGVAVAFVPEIPGAPVHGATRWLSPSKALIQLTIRGKTADLLWFAFYHEAGHVLLHGKREVFIEEQGSRDELEMQADQFACDCLIPRRPYNEFIRSKPFSHASIERFAQEVGIAPGIVVGRLQHDRLLPYKDCNDMKQRLTWGSED